jgi:hypothetical protein
MDAETPVRFPAWQREYDAVLNETDTFLLFKRIEVAEARILARLEAIEESGSHHSERAAIADALTYLASLKSNRLGFHK